MKPKLLKHIWYPTFYDSFMFILICAGLALCAFFLYTNLNQIFNSGEGERIGTLIIKRNLVQRKLAKQVIWERTIEKGSPLYNQDTIRTGAQSSALIRLNDKTEIDIDEQSLIVMDIVGQESNINFAQGSIRIKREEGSASLKGLKIHSENHVVSLDKANLNLKLRENTGKLDVLVNQGKAAILSAEGEEYNVDKNEHISFHEGEAKFRKIPISLKSPHDGYRFTFNDSSKKIKQTFQWEVEKGTRAEYFEISRNPDFSSIFRKKPVRGQQVSLKLGEGNYYWRLSFYSIGVRERQYTSNFKLSLIANNVSLHGFALQKEELSSQADIDHPPVSLSWNKIPSASSYIIELSRDPKISKIMKSYKRQTPSLNLRLAVGKYYWRIKAKTTTEGQAIESKIYSLKVHKARKKADSSSPSDLLALLKGKNSKTLPKNTTTVPQNSGLTKSFSLAKFPANTERKPLQDIPKAKPVKTKVIATPVLHLPAQDFGVHLLVLKAKGLLFRWTIDASLDSAQFIIASDKSFSERLHEQIVSGKNEVRVQISLEAGLYYWRVVGLKDSKPASPPSEIHSFQVYGKGISKIILTEPENEIFFFSGDDPKINFIWEKADVEGSYQFYFAEDRGFRRRIQKLSTEDTGVSLTRPKKEAKYYWKVQIEQEGISIAESEVRFFGVMNSSSYVELKTGEKIRGRNLKLGKDYVYITTPKGKRKYSTDEVDDVSY